MNKKLLFEKTRQIFKEYGFKIQRNRFYIDFDEVQIVVGINDAYGSYLLEYNFSIKAIHSQDEKKQGNMFLGYDLGALAVFMDKEKKLYIDDMLEESYEDNLREMIHRYIDPFKNNAIDFIKNGCIIPPHMNKIRFLVTKKAQEFLGIKYE